MKNKILLVLFLLWCLPSMAQQTITWDDLAGVEYEKKLNKEFNQYIPYPKFSEPIKALDGQKITIKGYFLDIDPSGTIFVLSNAPMASCFFCGAGGPETIMELKFPKKPDFKMDDIVKVTGTLKLNVEDLQHLMYVLEDCTAVKAK